MIGARRLAGSAAATGAAQRAPVMTVRRGRRTFSSGSIDG
jgi:hypothetical protein